jgi:quinol monooxygenase YgiN
MASAVSWMLHLDVADGQLDTFRALMEEMVESTRSDEAGALVYEWFLSEDGRACHLYERYADPAAAMEHLGNFGSSFAERFFACVQPSSFHVYGEPGDEVRAALTEFGAVFLGTFGGFAR